MSDSDLTKIIRCVGCKYDLQGLSDVSRCPECGESVALSRIFAECPRMVKKERDIIRKENYYRRNRQAAGGLAILSFFSIVMFFSTIVQFNIVPQGDDRSGFQSMLMTSIFSTMFWTAIAYAMHARYQHARSARLYRGYIEGPGWK